MSTTVLAGRPPGAAAEARSARSAYRRPESVATALVAMAWTACALVTVGRLGAPPAPNDEIVYVRAGWSYLHRGGPYPNPEHVPLAKYLFGLAETLAGHESLVAARAMASICTLLTAVLISLLARDTFGRWIGHACGLAFIALPCAVEPMTTPFGRAAMLEPVAGLFVTVSVIAAWRWCRCPSGPRAWWAAVALGAAVGLAAGSKELAFTPAAGAVVAVVAGANGRRLERALQAGTAALISVVTLLALYLPLGNPIEGVRQTITRQVRNSTTPHAIGFAGRVSDRPPWWANLWFLGHSQGALVTTAELVLVLAALALVRDVLVRMLLAALVAAVLVQCWAVHLVLPFYWEMWRPLLILLGGAGARALTDGRPLSGSGSRAKAARISAAVLLAVAVTVPSAAAMVQTATATPVGPQAVRTERSRLHLHGTIVSTGTYSGEFAPYLAPTSVDLTMPATLRGVDTVLVSRPRCRDPRDRVIQALVAVNLAHGRLRQVHRDRLLTMYVRTGALLVPTPAQVADVVPDTVTTGC